MREAVGVYIHFPFCVKKCSYCDFLSGPAYSGTRKAYAESFVGETVSVLFEDRTVIDGKSMLTGYTREYVPVLMETEEDLMNRILDVRAESVTPRGEIIASLIE